MELFYCGAQLPETVADAFRAALPRREAKAYPLPETQIFAQPPHGKRYFEESLPVTQGKLCLGFRTGITSDDPRYPALLLTNAVYGGTTSSRLFRNVREKMSLMLLRKHPVLPAQGRTRGKLRHRQRKR